MVGWDVPIRQRFARGVNQAGGLIPILLRAVELK